MSDAQKLKDSIAEFRKVNKDHDDKLKTAETVRQQYLQTTTEQQSRQG